MSVFGLIFWMLITFGISWWNSYAVGCMWSEAKEIKGQVRVLSIAGYVMAVAGFTMVYTTILILLSAWIIPYTAIAETFPTGDLLELTYNLMYVMIIIPVLTSGIIIWYHSALSFWKRKNVGNGLVLGWNSYANVRNIISATRQTPNALKSIANILFGRKGKKGKGDVILLAVFIVILAICGGWFTTSAIVKKADREYDGLEKLKKDSEGYHGDYKRHP